MTRIASLALASLLLAACAGESEEMAEEIAAEGTPVDATQELAMDTVAAVVPEGAGGMTLAADLQPLNNSGVTGQATMTESGQQVQAAVRISGANPGEHPGHVHRGSCDNLGPVVVPLPAITVGADGNGSATGTAAISADSLMAGGLVVNYHATDGAPIACGPIAHSM